MAHETTLDIKVDQKVTSMNLFHKAVTSTQHSPQ